MQERRRQERIETNEVAYTGWVARTSDGRTMSSRAAPWPSRHHCSLRAHAVPQLFWGTYSENRVAKCLIPRD